MGERFGKIVLVMFALCALASAVSAAGLDVNSFNYEPAPVRPGSAFDLWVHVKNDNYTESTEAVFELEVDYPFSIGSQSRIVYLGTMKPYQITVVKFTVNVDPSASDGAYVLYAKVGHEKKVDKKVPITITLTTKKPVIEIIEGAVVRAAPGDEAEAKLLIKNIGSSLATDIIVSVLNDRTVTSTGVVVEREILPLGASATYLKSLDAGEQQEVSLLLGINNDADLKTYTVPISITYYDRDRNSLSTIAYVGVKVTGNPELDSVISDGKGGIYLGRTAEMRFDLFNVGIATAKYVVVNLESDVLTITEPKQFIGTLEADDFDSFKTNVQVKPGVMPGKHSLTLKITYKDQENKEQLKIIPLTFDIVAGAPAGEDGVAAVINLLILVVIILAIWFVGSKVLPIPGPGILLALVRKKKR